MDPWICPRCKRVYGPSMMECQACNKEAAKWGKFSYGIYSPSTEKDLDENYTGR